MIYACISLSRPGFAEPLAAMLAAQTAPHEVIVVEGPDARGAWQAPAAVILQCDARTPAAARNAALDYVRALPMQPGGYVWPRIAWLDEDDCYGPEYLSEVARALECGHVARRGTVPVRLSDGEEVTLRDGPGRELRLGGTLGARVFQGLPRFDESARPYSEDGRWVWACHQAGLRVTAIYGSDQYTWIRHEPVGRSGISDVLIRRLANAG